MAALAPPPLTLAATREALRALACYVISPARKARTGRIGLRPSGEGIATPQFDDGTRIAVRGNRLLVEPGFSLPITTLRDAARLLGVALTPDPGVGRDLPPFAPDDQLAVDAEASTWLGGWYAFGSRQLERLAGRLGPGVVTEAQLWPEHMDLAVTVDVGESAVNVGFSPGDKDFAAPYVYVGPHDRTGLTGNFWNARFGASLSHAALQASADPAGLTATFIDQGLLLVDARRITRSRCGSSAPPPSL